MHQDLLSVENLEVSFLNEKTLKAVEDVSFAVEREEILGLVGESGCGKTLTALSIIGLTPPNTFLSGKILFQGEELLSKEKEEMRKLRGKDISMVFQEPMTSLNPVFTIGHQISEALMCHGEMKKNHALDKTVELLHDVGIPSPESRIKEYPHQMSGGMRQRVMIAMAIACNPSLLIADEPTTALDVTIQAQILGLLDSLKEKNRMSMLLITHDLGIIAEWAHRVIIMYAGRIIEVAHAREIFTNPKHPYTVGLLESVPTRRGERLTPIPGVVPRMDELPQGCKFSTRCRYVIEDCRLKEPGLLSYHSYHINGKTREHLSRCIRANEL
ncbi:MAG: ABC transporter ATP-binding protein [Nitrospiraceae bacterium]|nr:MAG: ABC transporter ATP-binding protein [Nitrospiraceae bacterium]